MKLMFDIEPVHQARPRATTRNTGGTHARLYDPPKVKSFKTQLQYLAKAKRIQRFNDSIEVSLKFYRRVQDSVSHIEHDRRISGVHRPTVKPDVDNYIKATLDALNGIIWKDDAQIVTLHAAKYYSDHPRIEMEIEVLK
ncbi:RusA family crossover junction endodeoxyribonuclease [Ligilactobacillus pobuzihii]|uniref:RusA family crossover junction endodeoxyribonuclease n=1 Tax=Ligilactobacillus pobuzihii TaxID=449659 RepID=UPI0019D07AD6|nr:RusA family crossover junction endodeoxyribonuclease [Ligilactobacillus pobuzihii]MBN7275536.1 RusA family crossover junction endodeoxyribonuclease [Ligilactobacillus pobuzihii]